MEKIGSSTSWKSVPSGALRSNCISSNQKIYLSKLTNIFVQKKTVGSVLHKLEVCHHVHRNRTLTSGGDHKKIVIILSFPKTHFVASFKFFASGLVGLMWRLPSTETVLKAFSEDSSSTPSKSNFRKAPTHKCCSVSKIYLDPIRIPSISSR